MSTVHCFEPVVDANCRVLILGSIPGNESLRKRQYYGHAQNAFWRLISTLLNEPYEQDYAVRLAMLLRHRIALWDVIKSCDRETSMDARIKNADANDFHSFFQKYDAIKHVFFNGQKAYAIFARHVGFDFEGRIFTRLGSTSPAHAVPFEKRIEDWMRITAALNE